MKIAVFHPGTQHSWQTATAIQELGRLHFYSTSIFYKPDEWPYRIEGYLPARLRKRAHDEFRRFARFLEREIRSDKEFALWGYNSSSLESFELARRLGRFCVLDRTNGDFRVYNRIMEKILDRYGEYFLPGHQRIADWTIERDDREYAESDLIVVGSEFARSTLEDGCPDPSVAQRARVLNYCFDETLYSGTPKPEPVAASKPVKFLFLGQLIPRKGIHHVLEAIEKIPVSQAQLTLVGMMGVPKDIFARFADRVDFIPTVARADVPRIMSEHHVFLLPTYFEGAGIVLYEALASGMALIQSRNAALAATPDTGIMLEKIDTDHLLAAMMTVIEDRGRLDHFRAHAQAEAQNYTFARYRDNIAALLAEAGLG